MHIQANRGCAQLALSQQEMQLKTAMDSFRMKDSLCNQLQQQLQLLSEDHRQQAGKRAPNAQASHVRSVGHAAVNHAAACIVSEGDDDDEDEAIQDSIPAERLRPRQQPDAREEGRKQRHTGRRQADAMKGRRHTTRQAPRLALQAARPGQDEEDDGAGSDLDLASSGVTFCLRGLGSRGAKVKLDLTS